MKSLKFLATLSAFALSSAMAASTDPVGFVSTTVPANSDAVLAVPLNRASVFKGMIQTISGSTVTVAGTPAWTTAPQQFVQALPAQTNTYALQLASGAKEGLTAKIVSNTANSVTLQFEVGDDLTGVIAEDADGIAGNGDQIDIFPYWTPSSLITSVVAQDSQILQFTSATAGVNLPANAILFFDSGAWYDDNFNEANHIPLPFGTSFIYRNGGASTTLSMVGSVPMSKHRVLVRTRANNVDQDIRIGFSSPVPVAVGSIGLNFAEDDQILVYDNSASGQNKPAVTILYYTTADGWVDDSFNPVGTTFMIQPGQGYVFRKKATPTPQTIVWTALQSYLQ
jgi:uncharacterized protein (TIGR02597 family)